MSASTTENGQANGSRPATGHDKAARRKRFEDVFPIIAEELLGHIRGEGMPRDAVEWYEKVGQLPWLFPMRDQLARRGRRTS